MNEKDGGPSRAFAGSLVDELKSAGLHGIEGLLRALHAEGDMCQTAAAAVFVNQLLYRRLGSQWLEQLNQVGTVADLQQSLPYLISAVHFFAVNFAEAEHLVGLDLRVQFALFHRDGYVIDELNAWDVLQVFMNAGHLQFPSVLKPSSYLVLGGTAEGMPFPNASSQNDFSKRLLPHNNFWDTRLYSNSTTI